MRAFVLLTLFLFCVIPSFANNPKESKTRYYRHEVSISLGGIMLNSGWSEKYEKNVMNRFGLVVGKSGTDHGPGTGIIFQSYDEPKLYNDSPLKIISYYYHFDHHIAVGGLFGFCNVDDWLGYPRVINKDEIQKTGYTDVRGTSIFLMPSAKWTWLNNRWCSLYMKASAGFHYQSLYLDSETIPSEETSEFNKSHLGFAYYITPFGWEVGAPKIRWFIELGIGSNTNLQMGLMYRFGRF